MSDKPKWTQGQHIAGIVSEDHHNKNWYRNVTMRIAERAQEHFNVNLNATERFAIESAIYRAVIDAKLRTRREAS